MSTTYKIKTSMRGFKQWMDAKISMEIWDYGTQCIKALEGVSYDKDNNIIDLC